MAMLIGTATSGRGKGSGTLGLILSRIRAESGLPDLKPETFNVRLAPAFTLSPTFTVPFDNAVGHEDYFFQRCSIDDLPCLIMRNSTNTHGDCVVEIMAEVKLRDRFGFADGDPVTIAIDETSPNESATR